MTDPKDKPSVLVVDDETGILDSLNILLRNEGFTPRLAHGGKAKMSFTEPIVVTGTLKITTVKSPYGDVSYNLDGETVKPYAEQ